MKLQKPQVVHHFVGVFTAIVVFGLVAKLDSVGIVADHYPDSTSSDFRIVSSNDYLGLSRIAASKALEGDAVAFVYDSKVACQLDNLAKPTQTVLPIMSSPETTKWTGGIAVAGKAETLSDVCANGASQPFFLTASEYVRTIANGIGTKPSFVAITGSPNALAPAKID